MNVVLHYVVPAAMVIDWLVDLPVRAIEFRSAAVWLAYPVAYLAYSLIRGTVVDWYPYPFLDPRHDGYGHVAIMSGRPVPTWRRRCNGWPGRGATLTLAVEGG